MSWKLKVAVGVLLIVFGVVFTLAGFSNGSSVHTYLKNSDTFTRVSDSQYNCTDAKAAYDELVAETDPQAHKEDKGTYYLRYPKELATISQESGKCVLRFEDLRRVNSGHFIFLGTGFSPGSPSGSSGGTGGNSFGNK